jgi:PAS domain S-box-containing protein
MPTPSLGIADRVADDFRPLSAEQANLLEASPFPVLVLDRAFRIRFVNAASAAFGQVDRASLIGLNVWSRYPALEGSIFQQAYAAVLEHGTPQRFEEHRPSEDSWLSVFAYPADGGVVAVLQDVSEQRRVERALLESELTLSRAQALAGIGSWVWTLPDTMQWSAEAFRIMGLDPTVITPSLALIRDRLLDHDERVQWETALSATRDGRDFDVHLSFSSESGPRVLHVIGQVRRNAAGQTTQVHGTMQDVTTQLRADEDLRRSEKTLRLAQEAANIGSFDRDLRTNQSRWSDQLVRIFGFDPATVDQASFGDELRADLIHPDDRVAVEAWYRQAIATGAKQSMRHRIFRADGSVRHLYSCAMLLRDARGEPARLVGTSLDITEQVRAEQEAERADLQIQQAQKLESLGLLAGGIAHDFNNLLVGMLGNASLALLELEPDSPARQSVEEIGNAAQRAADLTRQLLAYAGKGRFIIESVDVSMIVNEMAALLRTAVSRNASVQLDLPVSLPSIEVDSTQFRQVVMNLITNASDALADQPGLISLRTGKQSISQAYLDACVAGTDATPGEFVFVEVRDTGMGMDATTQLRIFDPFFSTKFTGRGLGLAATLGIMRGHRGAIHVYSELGSGTSIKLHFPASASVATPSVAPRESDWIGSGRVLVVDDDAAVRMVTHGLLQRRGFEVIEADGGDVALELYAVDPSAFALVLLDLTMPGLSGDETFRAIRSIRPDARVVLMSGYNEQDVTQLFVGRGLAAFLQKPFRAEELYNTIAAALR